MRQVNQFGLIMLLVCVIFGACSNIEIVRPDYIEPTTKTNDIITLLPASFGLAVGQCAQLTIIVMDAIPLRMACGNNALGCFVPNGMTDGGCVRGFIYTESKLDTLFHEVTHGFGMEHNQ